MSRNKNIAALFSSCYASVKGHLLLKYGVGDDADDIVQDTFQKMLGMSDMEVIENPKAYLFRAASNLALNRIRRQGYQDDYIASLDQDTAHPCLQRQFLANADLERVQKVLGHLSEKDRKTFLLNRIDGKSYRQISEELNVTLSTVEKRMMKVLSLLRKAIDE
jgi:RNA polymerase sigma factor (sigma-70 family)